MGWQSNQKLYCNICGILMPAGIPAALGREVKVCSQECLKEYQWRYALSIMNKPYRPQDGALLEEKDGSNSIRSNVSGDVRRNDARLGSDTQKNS